MKELKDIRDDQIRIVGESEEKKPLQHNIRVAILVLFRLLIVVVIGVIILVASKHIVKKGVDFKQPEPSLFEPIELPKQRELKKLGKEVDSLAKGFTEIRDTIINDILLKIYIPHNAELSLHIGRVDKGDTNIVYVAQAADVRADNGGIVGAFVLKGEPKAWGLSKKGFCASINGKVTIGVADNTSLFEEATVNQGYFFRQYPLVKDGVLIDNEPKGKAIRRAICDRRGEIFMVHTDSIESFHDFAQALVDLGVNQAVYLVGSSAYGWAVDENGIMHEFGEDNYSNDNSKMAKNTNYIVWRK